MTINNSTISSNLDAAATGRSSSTPFVDIFMTRDPTSNDVQYPVQKKWLNTTDGTFWELQNFTTSQGVVTANWIKIGSVGLVETLTGNDSIAVPATANNINVVGDGTYIHTTGNAATSTLTISPAGGLTTLYTANFGTATPTSGNLNVLGAPGATTTASGDTITITSSKTANIVVSPILYQGDYITITAAMAAAVSGDNIFLREGTYEEDFTAKAGVGLFALAGSADETTVIIKGKISYSAAGIFTVAGIELQTNGDYYLDVSGSAASVVNLEGCYLNATNHTGIDFTSSNASSNINIFYCDGDLGTTGITYWTCTGAGLFKMTGGYLINSSGSTTPSTFSGTSVNVLKRCEISAPLVTDDTAQTTCQYFISACNGISGICITANSTHGLGTLLSNCVLAATNVEAISVGVGAFISLQGKTSISSGATDVITGAGTVVYSDIDQNATPGLINAAIELPYLNNLGTIQVLGSTTFQSSLIGNLTSPGVYPYDVALTDYFIEVDTGSSRTINLPNAPPTGQIYIIKDATGGAGSNHIDLTTIGGVVDIDGSTSVTISTAYQTVRVIFNGSSYLTW